MSNEVEALLNLDNNVDDTENDEIIILYNTRICFKINFDFGKLKKDTS